MMKMQANPSASHMVKGLPSTKGADDGGSDWLGKAVKAGLLGADQLDALHIAGKGQNIADDDHTRNAEQAIAVGHIAHRPRLKHQQRQPAAQQKGPALEHRGWELLLQIFSATYCR